MKQQSINLELFSQIHQLFAEAFENFRETSKDTNEEHDAVIYIGQAQSHTDEENKVVMRNNIAICGRNDVIHDMLVKQMAEDDQLAEVILDAARCHTINSMRRCSIFGGLEQLFSGLAEDTELMEKMKADSADGDNSLTKLLAKIRAHNSQHGTSKWEQRMKEMQEKQRKRKQG